MHFMGDVALKKCGLYSVSRVEEAIGAALSLLAVDLAKEVSGGRVLLKPNLLGAHLPEKAVTTHPVFVEAVIRFLSDFNCEIWVGDSPNGVQKSIEDVWLKTGMEELCNRYGVKKKIFESEGARLIDDLLISNAILEVDYIINLPKFKTHGLTVLTGAVKNMFGAVPGLKKTDHHRKNSSKEKFGEALVRIAEKARPNLNIIDGITAMAGNGPSGGYSVDIGLIAMGRDMHEVDLVLSKLVGVSPHHVDTLGAAEKLGLIDLSVFPHILGEAISSFDMSNFKLPVTYTSNLRDRGWFKFLLSRFMHGVKIKPKANKEKCVICGMCVEICPVHAIKPQNNYPVVDYKKCIECYCCSEVCPEKAMDLKESLCLKLFKKFSARS